MTTSGQHFLPRFDGWFPDSWVQDPSSSSVLKRELDEDIDWIPKLFLSALTIIAEIALWGILVAKAILVAISLNLRKISLKTGSFESVNVQVRGQASSNWISSE